MPSRGARPKSPRTAIYTERTESDQSAASGPGGDRRLSRAPQGDPDNDRYVGSQRATVLGQQAESPPKHPREVDAPHWTTDEVTESLTDIAERLRAVEPSAERSEVRDITRALKYTLEQAASGVEQALADARQEEHRSKVEATAARRIADAADGRYRALESDTRSLTQERATLQAEVRKIEAKRTRAASALTKLQDQISDAKARHGRLDAEAAAHRAELLRRQTDLTITSLRDLLSTQQQARDIQLRALAAEIRQAKPGDGFLGLRLRGETAENLEALAQDVDKQRAAIKREQGANIKELIASLEHAIADGMQSTSG